MTTQEIVAAGLRPLYQFDQLVIGSHNMVAVGACREVLKKPGEIYNPLYIYGPAGVGKTHLIQSVAHEMLKQDPSRKVRYVSAERFMSEILTAISEDRIVDLRRLYSALDLLMLDDIQYLPESKISQDELFHIFNNLHQENRQVILAADRPPNQLTALNKGIRSRLEWGLATDVKIPDAPTRIEILRKKQALQGLDLGDEILSYVAHVLHSNVRELEGFLKRIHAYATLTHQEITPDLVKAVVVEIYPEAENPPVPVAPAASAKSPVAKDSSLSPIPATPPPAPPLPPELSREEGTDVPPVPSAPRESAVRPVINGANGHGKQAPPPAPTPPRSAPPTPPEGAFDFDQFNLPEPTLRDSTTPSSGPLSNHDSFDLLLNSIDTPTEDPAPKKSGPAPKKDPSPEALRPPAPPSAPISLVPPVSPVPEVPAPESMPAVESVISPLDEGEMPAGHKEVTAVFFYPEGAEDALDSVHSKFQDVIRKHKLKFRLRRVHSQSYAFKGKVNYSNFVDICKANKVPVAVVIGPPPNAVMPEQDFYDLLTVTLDVQGVSLQLVNWTEIDKDYRYLNLALDIALVRTR